MTGVKRPDVSVPVKKRVLQCASVMHEVVVKKGEQDIPGLTETRPDSENLRDPKIEVIADGFRS